jgi:hypothetical protein
MMIPASFQDRARAWDQRLYTLTGGQKSTPTSLLFFFAHRQKMAQKKGQGSPHKTFPTAEIAQEEDLCFVLSTMRARGG